MPSSVVARRRSPRRGLTPRDTTTLAFRPLLAVVIFTIACSGEMDTPTSPGRGAVRMAVTPNPIIAMSVAGTEGTYAFPFEIAITEVGGQTVTVTRLNVTVKTLGLPVFTKTYDASYLRGQNYSPIIPAMSTVRYSFNPREQAPAAVFGSAVETDIQVEGIDDQGNPVRQTVTVSVRRG